ncbi:MAG: hypothetical protein ACJ8AD_03190, partial [Gemmatimonadaceae bacterium]
MRTRSLISASLGVALLAACATGGVGTGQASPEAIVRLEKQQTASPTSAAVNRALGAGDRRSPGPEGRHHRALPRSHRRSAERSAHGAACLLVISRAR